MNIVTIHCKGNRMLPARETGRAIILNEGVQLAEIQDIAARISQHTADFGGNPVHKLEDALKDKGTFIQTSSVTVIA